MSIRDPVSRGRQLLGNDPTLSSDLYLCAHSSVYSHAPAPMNTHRKDLNSRIENSSLCTYEGNRCPYPSSFLTNRFHGTTWLCPLTPDSANIGEVLHAERVLCGTAPGLSAQLGLINYKCLLVLSALYSGISSRSLVLSQPLVMRFSPYLIAMRSVLKVDWPETCLQSLWSGILGQC